MKKIALVIILGMVLGISNFGSALNVANAKKTNVPDPGFDFAASNFKYSQDDPTIIEHYLSYTEGLIRARYRQTTVSGTGIGWVNVAGFEVRGSLKSYKLFDITYKYGSEKPETPHLTDNENPYQIFILESIISTVGYTPIDESQLPRVVILTGLPKKSGLGSLVLNDGTIKYVSAKGGESSIFAWYIKKTADYIRKNAATDKKLIIQPASSVEFQEQEKILETLQKKCIDKLIDPVTSTSPLPLEIRTMLDNIDPDNKIYPERTPTGLENLLGKQKDKEIYRIFYRSADKNISNRHFTGQSSARTQFELYSENFSQEFTDSANNRYYEKAKKILNVTASAAVGLLTLVATRGNIKKTGIAAGLTFLGVNWTQGEFEEIMKIGGAKPWFLKMILADYYINKHFEYHQCIVDKAEELNLIIPDNNEFSARNLAKERKEYAQVMDVTMNPDIENLKQENINDCGFKLGNDRVNEMLCAMMKGFLALMGDFFDKGFDFLQSVINKNVTS